MVARQLSRPRTANWIASEAGLSRQPARRALERLVEAGTFQRDESGARITYVTDYRRQTITEAIRLRDDAESAVELVDTVSTMADTIDDWEGEFGVESRTNCARPSGPR